jgi:hypothetical protein
MINPAGAENCAKSAELFLRLPCRVSLQPAIIFGINRAGPLAAECCLGVLMGLVATRGAFGVGIANPAQQPMRGACRRQPLRAGSRPS